MTFSSLSKSFARLFPVCLFGLSAAMLLPGLAMAQDFDELPMAEKYEMVEIDDDDPNRRELSRVNRDARAVRKSGLKAIQTLLASGANVDVPATKEYLDGFVFPSMTMEESLRDAGRLRFEFDRSYLGTKFTTASRVPFIENVLMPRFKTIVENEDLSPAARVNAVVMISRLDDSPLVRTTKTAPRPSLAAFDELVAIWRGQSPDYLKAAAFSGILRHMQVDNAVASARIPGDKKSQLMGAVTASVDAILAEDPELKEDLNRWKVSKSVELMSQARLASETEAYFDRMSAMLAKDSKAPKWVKLEAIRGLTRMDLRSIAPAKIDSLIESSISYASDSLSGEARHLEKRVEDLIYDNILWDNEDLEVTGTDYTDNPKATGGMGMGGMGMSGMGMGGGMEMGGMGGGKEGGGMGMGMGGMGMGGMGMTGEKPDPIVELPNFELNLSRRRMKLVVSSVDQLLSLKPIQDNATEGHKDGLAALTNRFQEFLNKDSNIGLVDLAKKKKDSDLEELQTESYATQLKRVCEGMSTELAIAVSKMRGEEMKKPSQDLGAPGESPFPK